MIFNPILIKRNNQVSFSYTGNYLESEYQGTDGVSYKLYTLTSSGVLTAKMKNADIWLCGGGAVSKRAQYSGGAGAYCKQIDAQNLDGAYAIAIAAAGGETIFEIQEGTNLASGIISGFGSSGGTGGGGSRFAAGTGDGKTKYPFDDATNFQCHCAGGGGGGLYDQGSRKTGGSGGTNGGNGNPSTSSSYSSAGGSGGAYGGGRGGSVYSAAASGGAATFYGGGGGGAGYYYAGGSTTQQSSGAGYQGVCYIRVPA